jgi:sec-independent protein translocase protein TatB
MFDISFTEILVIAVVALVVLGPERLPHVARTLGHLFGRAQRYVNDVKSDIQREMELEELKKLKTSVQDAARSIENTVRGEVNQLQESTDIAEAKSIAMTTSVPTPGILAETAAPPDSLATPTKPAKPKPVKPLIRSKSSPDEATGADTVRNN